jgi:hypothetical protein
MKLVPLAPVRQQEWTELEVLALHGTRNSFQARLLPAAIAFPIAKDFVATNHTGVFKMQLFVLPFGPEHEGRITVGSPGHSDRTIGKLVLYQSV